MMPVFKPFVAVLCLLTLSGCAAVAVGGAVVGVTTAAVGTTVKATTAVAGAAIDVAIPDGDDDD